MKAGRTRDPKPGSVKSKKTGSSKVPMRSQSIWITWTTPPNESTFDPSFIDMFSDGLSLPSRNPSWGSFWPNGHWPIGLLVCVHYLITLF